MVGHNNQAQDTVDIAVGSSLDSPAVASEGAQALVDLAAVLLAVVRSQPLVRSPWMVGAKMDRAAAEAKSKD